MNRRSFLRSIAAAVVAVPLAPLVARSISERSATIPQYGIYFLASDVIESIDPLDQVWSLGYQANWAEASIDSTSVIRFESSER